MTQVLSFSIISAFLFCAYLVKLNCCTLTSQVEWASPTATYPEGSPIKVEWCKGDTDGYCMVKCCWDRMERRYYCCGEHTACCPHMNRTGCCRQEPRPPVANYVQVMTTQSE